MFLDTAKHGLPQHRERVFIVGIRRRNSHREGRAEFCWPRLVACRPLARLLDPLPVGSDVGEAERNFLATCSPGQKKRLLQAFLQVEAAGLDRHCDEVVVVVDVDGAKARWTCDVPPCLTRTRAALGFYLPARGRRMTLAERFRLQGISLRVLRCREGISDRQFGMIFGNAFCLNVLERLLVRMLMGLRLTAALEGQVAA